MKVNEQLAANKEYSSTTKERNLQISGSMGIRPMKGTDIRLQRDSPPPVENMLVISFQSEHVASLQ